MLPEKNSLGLISSSLHDSLSGVAARKGSPGGRSSSAPQTQKPYSGPCYVPWRAAARAGRQR